MDRESFILYIRTDDVKKDIVEDFKTRFYLILQLLSQIDHFLK